MFDVLISGGEVYDGSGADPVIADLAIAGDRVVQIRPRDRDSAEPGPADAAVIIDATGKAVSPGFINILSHSYLSILHDPRSLGELTQGVTTEVFGEGSSMGPLTPRMKSELQNSQNGLSYEVCWTRLREYLDHVEHRGTSQNVASFIGGGTIRINGVGFEDRPATAAEMDRMRALVAEEMADGALGIASALIYPPGSYAGTAEITEMCAVAARYNGCYASHIRSEGEDLHGALREFLAICRDAGLRGEVFHLKAAGRQHWDKMDGAIELLEQARAAGEPVTADVYPYPASSTGLTSIIPDRYHEGGSAALYDRLADPEVRGQIRAELQRSRRWGDVTEAESVLILQVTKDENRHCQGRTLADIAAEQGADPIDTALDLIASDRSRVGTAFFSMSEDNLRQALQRPWIAVSSDGASMAPEGAFLQAPTHPRAYGSFARVLGHYARDEKVLTLADAIHRMSGLPAATLGLRQRGLLREGYFADVVVFDPETIADRATFADPHQLSTGVSEVLVNGKITISGGAFTGELAGRALAGPGARR
ncbi:MAG TPA: D-aminoacylase [Streptosporangiaceae bacterium]|nr:D-aminoacylase [Streptosporangiaceae bacterium]